LEGGGYEWNYTLTDFAVSLRSFVMFNVNFRRDLARPLPRVSGWRGWMRIDRDKRAAFFVIRQL
jgi:hypothetical protein